MASMVRMALRWVVFCCARKVARACSMRFLAWVIGSGEPIQGLDGVLMGVLLGCVVEGVMWGMLAHVGVGVEGGEGCWVLFCLLDFGEECDGGSRMWMGRS